ncbi:hypothetical protein TNCV_916891 [Trichonephila clavipes]|nr:hypothetical protein TNCV_916891 [Trichonephila clavipes]
MKIVVCFPIPLNASPDNSTNDEVKENNMPDSPNNANLKLLPNNTFYERVSQIPLNATSKNCSNEAVKENNMPYNPNN